MKLHRWIALNSSGRRIGQEHPRAKFTDREVELTLQLREQGLSLSEIARKMEVSKSTVSRWVNGTSRGQPAARWLRSEYGTQNCTGKA